MNSERTVIADDDSGLVTRFLRGDTTAFDSLFLKYQDYVYNIIFGIVGSSEEARDLTQEVFVQVYRSLPKFRHGSRFATWLYRIAANRAVDATRSSRGWRFLPMPEEPILARFVAQETSPEDAFERGLERDTVQGVLMLCPCITGRCWPCVTSGNCRWKTSRRCWSVRWRRRNCACIAPGWFSRGIIWPRRE